MKTSFTTFTSFRSRVSDTLKVLVAACLLTLATGAHAMDLNGAKRAGLVGETLEGYVALVTPTAPSEVAALVDEVNARRRTEYQRIAQQNGIGLAEVEALAAKKAIEKTQAGGWVRINGGWRQK
jgi:uncharacterized protein